MSLSTQEFEPKNDFKFENRPDTKYDNMELHSKLSRDSRLPNPCAGFDCEEKILSYGLSTNTKIVISWALWAAIGSASLLCLFPFYNRASLWVPHLSLHLNESDNSFWVYYVEEIIHLISQFATDLQGVSLADYNSDIDFVSNSIYAFDFTSWCRQNPSAGSAYCYSGHGLDVITALVTDMGVQVGIAGRMEDSSFFGRSLALKFQTVIHHFDNVYHEAHLSPVAETLDMARLTAVHKVSSSMQLGQILFILNVVHGVLFVLTCLAFFIPMTTDVFWKCSNTLLPMFILMILCELVTLTNYVVLASYLTALNSVFRVHGVIFTMGLGSTLLLMEFLASIVLVILRVVLFYGGAPIRGAASVN